MSVELPHFAVAVYRRDGVSAACMHLQERFAADVNLLLCGAYLAAVRQHAPTPDDVHRLRDAVAEWHREIVLPLRSVRRRLKSGPPPAPNDASSTLRARVQRDEIEAELIELATLGSIVDSLPTGSVTGDVNSVCAAIAVFLDGATDAAVGVLASAALAERMSA